MSLFLSSIIVLWIGPLLLTMFNPVNKILIWIDRLVIFFISFLVIFHVVPESIEQSGLIAIISILFGALWPLIYQIISNSKNCQLQRSLVTMASVGVFMHTLLDGVALTSNIHLGAAVVLHRLPEGICIWRIFQTKYDSVLAFIVLTVMTIVTTIGYFFGNSWLIYAPENIMGIFEGLMAGVLLHVVFHKKHFQILLKKTKSIYKFYHKEL